MKPDNSAEQDYDQPVAYTADGQPLYARPQKQEVPAAQHQVVHMARPHEPLAPEISPETRARCETSRRRYPTLNLSDGEYVISAVRRHPIGLLPIISIVGVLVLGVWAVIPLLSDMFSDPAANAGLAVSSTALQLIALLLSILFLLGGVAAVYIYAHNRFYLTNESVVQEIQLSLFSRHEQTVSLANIEDASFYQRGIFQTIFNYGSIRLSTEGDETTYRFTYVANPKQHIAVLNNAVEAFKNGRPVGD